MRSWEAKMTSNMRKSREDYKKKKNWSGKVNKESKVTNLERTCRETIVRTYRSRL